MLAGKTPPEGRSKSYLATLAISAALRVREQTRRGQRVSTSLFQGVLATTLSGWQRVERVAFQPQPRAARLEPELFGKCLRIRPRVVRPA